MDPQEIRSNTRSGTTYQPDEAFAPGGLPVPAALHIPANTSQTCLAGEGHTAYYPFHTIFGDVPYYVQRYYLSSATVESVSESNSAPLLFEYSCSYVLMPLLLSTDAKENPRIARTLKIIDAQASPA